MNNKTQQIQEYVQFLKNKNHFQWKFWFTINTQKHLTQKSAHRLMKRFIIIVRDYLLEQEYENEQKSHIFYVVEPCEGKKGVHIHFLLQCDKNTRFATLRRLCNQAIGLSIGKSVCNIQAIQQEEHIFQYVAKKLISQRVEYDYIRIIPYQSI